MIAPQGDLIAPPGDPITEAAAADLVRTRRGSLEDTVVLEPDPAKTLSPRPRSPSLVPQRRKVCHVMYQILYIPFLMRKH